MSFTDLILEELEDSEHVSDYRRGPGDQVYFNPSELDKVHEDVVKRLSKLDRNLGYIPTGNYNEWKVIVKT